MVLKGSEVGKERENHEIIKRQSLGEPAGYCRWGVVMMLEDDPLTLELGDRVGREREG